jgi:hypothetical protein
MIRYFSGIQYISLTTLVIDSDDACDSRDIVDLLDKLPNSLSTLTLNTAFSSQCGCDYPRREHPDTCEWVRERYSAFLESCKPLLERCPNLKIKGCWKSRFARSKLKKLPDDDTLTYVRKTEFAGSRSRKHQMECGYCAATNL